MEMPVVGSLHASPEVHRYVQHSVGEANGLQDRPGLPESDCGAGESQSWGFIV